MLYVYIFLAGMIPLAAIFVVRVLRGDFNRPPPQAGEPAPRSVETQVPQVTRDDVERVVRRDFAPEQRDTVISLLGEYGDSGSSRMQLAILKLSDGDVEKVLEYVVLANQDFRDVLMLAEYQRASRHAFGRTTPEEKAAYERAQAEDWREYQEWLHAE
jgi:hypothetical protein